MKTQTAPAVWGELPTDGSLTETQIEEMARALLNQMTLAEKINQMSGDASRIWGGMEMLRGYNRTPILAGEDARNAEGVHKGNAEARRDRESSVRASCSITWVL